LFISSNKTDKATSIKTINMIAWTRGTVHTFKKIIKRIVKLVHLGNCSLELVTIARRLSGWRQPTSPRFKPRPPLNSKRRRRFQLTFHPLRARDDDHSANRHIVKLLPAEMTAPGHGYIPRVLLSRPRFCIYKTQEF
jgi:hypothetical protein